MKTYFVHIEVAANEKETSKCISSNHRQWVRKEVARVHQTQRNKVFCDERNVESEHLYATPSVRWLRWMLCAIRTSLLLSSGNSKLPKTRYAQRLRSVIYWDYLFLVCWANAKQTAHVPIAIIIIHIQMYRYTHSASRRWQHCLQRKRPNRRQQHHILKRFRANIC